MLKHCPFLKMSTIIWRWSRIRTKDQDQESRPRIRTKNQDQGSGPRARTKDQDQGSGPRNRIEDLVKCWSTAPPWEWTEEKTDVLPTIKNWRLVGKWEILREKESVSMRHQVKTWQQQSAQTALVNTPDFACTGRRQQQTTSCRTSPPWWTSPPSSSPPQPPLPWWSRSPSAGSLSDSCILIYVPLSFTRFHLNDTDPRLFSLVVELRDKNPRQEGLTSKTVKLILKNQQDGYISKKTCMTPLTSKTVTFFKENMRVSHDS